jgi:phosphate:Na+ symporter
MTADVEAARKLLREKSELRKAELEAADRHLERLREGRPESLETTSLHLDILSDLKRVHSHICSVAYPVLDAAGELEPRRSRQHEPAAIAPPATHPLSR